MIFRNFSPRNKRKKNLMGNIIKHNHKNHTLKKKNERVNKILRKMPLLKIYVIKTE